MRADAIRWLPFDPSRNFPDLGQRFIKGERALRDAAAAAKVKGQPTTPASEAINTAASGTGASDGVQVLEDMDDELDLSWSTVLKRSFEAYIRAERPNMYGEWISWDSNSAARD